jgi:hypothetical protein
MVLKNDRLKILYNKLKIRFSKFIIVGDYMLTDSMKHQNAKCILITILKFKVRKVSKPGRQKEYLLI